MKLNRLLGEDYKPFKKWMPLYCTWRKCKIMPFKIYRAEDLKVNRPYENHPDYIDFY